jgi:hypothetical protein
MAVGPVATVGICAVSFVETWGIGCVFGGIPVGASMVSGGYYIASSSLDELEETYNNWPTPCQ